MIGETYSTDFPTTTGAYDTSHTGDDCDVFVSKLDSDLSADLSCVYTISPTSKSFSYSSGAGSVNVTAGSSCSWTAASNATWIAVTSGSSGTGNGTVAYTVTANTGTSQRTGTMTIAGQTFTATQEGACAYTISPISQSFSSSGGTGSVAVTASSSSCSWTAVSNAIWITITSDNSGTGNGTVAYSVSTNTGTTLRTGTMIIAGQGFTVTQDGECVAESIIAVPNKLTLKKNGHSDVTITVKGADNCLVEGVTITATINGKGKRLIDVSPGSQETDANGQAVFSISAKDKKGTAVLKFKASGLDDLATVQVKVR